MEEKGLIQVSGSILSFLIGLARKRILVDTGCRWKRSTALDVQISAWHWTRGERVHGGKSSNRGALVHELFCFGCELIHRLALFLLRYSIYDCCSIGSVTFLL